MLGQYEKGRLVRLLGVVGVAQHAVTDAPDPQLPEGNLFKLILQYRIKLIPYHNGLPCGRESHVAVTRGTTPDGEPGPGVIPGLLAPSAEALAARPPPTQKGKGRCIKEVRTHRPAGKRRGRVWLPHEAYVAVRPKITRDYGKRAGCQIVEKNQKIRQITLRKSDKPCPAASFSHPALHVQLPRCLLAAAPGRPADDRRRPRSTPRRADHCS